MEYRVIRFFIDHDTLKEYSAGDKYSCADSERAQMLIKSCYIERMQEKEPANTDVIDDKPSKEPAKTAKAKSTTKKTATKKKA